MFTLLCTSLLTACIDFSILNHSQTIYERTQILRINGSGICSDQHGFNLVLSAFGERSLKVDKDYVISEDCDDNCVTLTLLVDRKQESDLIFLLLIFAIEMGRTTWKNPPIDLILFEVTHVNSSINLLSERVVVAQVLPTPSVSRNHEIIFASTSQELNINGTGFIGAQVFDLVFRPSSQRHIDYDIISTFPLSSNQVHLRLRAGHKWREEPGPLAVVSVDTGGGLVAFGHGVRVAVVQADVVDGLDEVVTVNSSSTTQVIYHDTANIVIFGTRFNSQSLVLYWENGLVGHSVHYSITTVTDNTISLHLAPSTYWRKDLHNLPGHLTLLAVKTDAGTVALGPQSAHHGCAVATVFEKPQAMFSNATICRTYSHELYVKGSGFPQEFAKPRLLLSPALEEHRDYILSVINRTLMRLDLLPGRAWGSVTGALRVMAINTRGDEAGWVTLPGSGSDSDSASGVQIAEVVGDELYDVRSVAVFPMGVRVYQSALQQSIVITGSGFRAGMTFNFRPDMTVGVEYDSEVLSDNKIVMHLKIGQMWRSDEDYIFVLSVALGENVHYFSGSYGLRVAMILCDPQVKAGSEVHYESQSKIITVHGHGFSNVADISVVLQPTVAGAFHVLDVREDRIRLQLNPGGSWAWPRAVELFMTKSEEHDMTPLLVTGMQCGAGMITFDQAVTVAFIRRDHQELCEDEVNHITVDAT